MARRRQRGEGSVSQRADGLWVGRYDAGTRNGRRYRPAVYARTQREAIRRLTEARRAYEATGVVGATTTVEEWMTHWLDHIAPRRVRPRTLDGYRSKVRLHILPAIGSRRLDRLTPQHVRDLDDSMAARGLAPRSRLQTHAILARALEVAVREGKITRNVARLVDRPSIAGDDERDTLTPVEIAAILRAAHGTPAESRWLAAVMLGLRQGEALGLQWGDVDLDEGTLTVRRALQRQPGRGLVFVEPKTRRSRRTIPMPRVMTDSLRVHHAAAGRPTGDTLVWCQPGGSPTDPRADWQAWKDLLGAAGVRDVRLHDARHAAASVLAGLGVHPVVVRDILGHTTVDMTLGTYTHAHLAQLREAVDALDTAHGAPEIEC